MNTYGERVQVLTAPIGCPVLKGWHTVADALFRLLVGASDSLANPLHHGPDLSGNRSEVAVDP
jgi:hypothetical protein